VLSVAIVLGCGRDDGGAPAAANREPVEATGADPQDSVAAAGFVVLALGDSLTAGYGLDDVEAAWPALLREELADAGIAATIINGGESGRTTAGGAGAIDWYLRRPIDLAIIALGGNDGLRGVALDAVERNLDTIVERTLGKYPQCRIVIAGMRAPPSMGRDYCEAFEAIFPRVAARHGAALVPFLLEGVAAEPALNQRDGIHPTAEGQRVLAENVWSVVRELVID
jgi:acyl-CoA thioesterase I